MWCCAEWKSSFLNLCVYFPEIGDAEFADGKQGILSTDIIDETGDRFPKILKDVEEANVNRLFCGNDVNVILGGK